MIVFQDNLIASVVNIKYHRMDGPSWIGRFKVKEWAIDDKARVHLPYFTYLDGEYWVNVNVPKWAEDRGIDPKDLTETDELILLSEWV